MNENHDSRSDKFGTGVQEQTSDFQPGFFSGCSSRRIIVAMDTMLTRNKACRRAQVNLALRQILQNDSATK